MKIEGFAIGDPVVSVGAVTDEEVELLGTGVYAGDFVPTAEARGFARIFAALNVPCPRIDFPNGKSIFTCESWWGTPAQYDKAVGARIVHLVDVDEFRDKRSTLQDCKEIDAILEVILSGAFASSMHLVPPANAAQQMKEDAAKQSDLEYIREGLQKAYAEASQLKSPVLVISVLGDSKHHEDVGEHVCLFAGDPAKELDRQVLAQVLMDTARKIGSLEDSGHQEMH